LPRNMSLERWLGNARKLTVEPPATGGPRSAD
jgi:hypothetical protein